MKNILVFILGIILLSSCEKNSKKVDNLIFTHTKLTKIDNTKFSYFVASFPLIDLPFLVNDSILRKSTLVEMKGLQLIDTVFVDKFLSFEKETKNKIAFHELVKFYFIGQIQPHSEITKLIYLKSYNSKYIAGGKKDIYKIVSFNKSGKLISQLDIAGFITDESKDTDKSKWNTCKINRDFSIELQIKEKLADYEKDTLYVLSKKTKKIMIQDNGHFKTNE